MYQQFTVWKFALRIRLLILKPNSKSNSGDKINIKTPLNIDYEKKG